MEAVKSPGMMVFTRDTLKDGSTTNPDNDNEAYHLSGAYCIPGTSLMSLHRVGDLSLKQPYWRSTIMSLQK